MSIISNTKKFLEDCSKDPIGMMKLYQEGTMKEIQNHYEKVNGESSTTEEEVSINLGTGNEQEAVGEANIGTNVTEEATTAMVNPIVVEEPSGNVKVDFSKMVETKTTMKPVKTVDPYNNENFNKLPLLERVKKIMEDQGFVCDISQDPSGLFIANLYIKDSYFGRFYIDRDGKLFNSIPKIVLSINPDLETIEDSTMLAIFNTNWPRILIDFVNGKMTTACDCITSQERELNDLFDLATIPAKVKEPQRVKMLKNLEMIKMEGVLNDILLAEKKSRFRIADFKDSGTFDLVSDDQVREGLLVPYSSKKPYRISVDLTKGGDERFVKVAL